MTTVVITCPGAFSTYNTDNFGGTLFEAPNAHLSAPSDGSGWNNWGLSESAANTDMNRMYDTILAAFSVHGADFVVVAGHSRGGQIIYKLFRERLADLIANVDPSKIRCISSGNPERNHTGRSTTNYDEDPPIYPGDQPYGNGYGLLPAQVGPFEVLCITRMYDEWADTPTDWDNAAAVDAIDTDYHSKYYECPEIGKDGLPTNWDEWSWWSEGNLTYLISGEPCQVPVAADTPMAALHGGKPARNLTRDAQLLDAFLREDVEKAFDRPVPALAYVAL